MASSRRRKVATAKDREELETFARFLVEHAAHRELERVVGRRLPLETVTVPREWWDPKPPEGK